MPSGGGQECQCGGNNSHEALVQIPGGGEQWMKREVVLNSGNVKPRTDPSLSCALQELHGGVGGVGGWLGLRRCPVLPGTRRCFLQRGDSHISPGSDWTSVPRINLSPYLQGRGCLPAITSVSECSVPSRMLNCLELQREF